MTAPIKPTPEEVQAAQDSAEFRWEYRQDIVDVTAIEDPPESRAPIINIRRRIVSDWENYA